MAKKRSTETNGTALLDAPASAGTKIKPTWSDEAIGNLADLPDYLAAKLVHLGMPTVGMVVAFASGHPDWRFRLRAWTESELDTLEGALQAELFRNGFPALPTKEPAAPPTREADDLAAWKAEVIAKTEAVKALHDEAQRDKARAASSKKAWEAASEALGEFILRQPEPMPLFDGKPATGQPGASGEEAWRSVPIGQLLASDDNPKGLSGGLVEKLEDQGFKTIGHLADWTAKGHLLTDLAGVGKVVAEKIEGALEAFWEARQQAAIDDAREDDMGRPADEDLDYGADDQAEDD